MGLLTVLRKQRQREKEMRILMLGLDNAGKTTVVKKLLGQSIDEIAPTFGFNISTLFYDKYTLHVWDVGGQKRLRAYWRNYFESTDAVIWVVDSTDRMRLSDCRDELHALLVEERLAGASLLVFANKQDLTGALSKDQIKDILELDRIKTHPWKIQECSAVTGEHVVEGLEWVVQDVAQRLYTFA